MSAQDDSAEKEHDPSARKLEQALAKGELVRSADLTTTAAYAGLALALLTVGASSVIAAADVGKVMLDQADQLSSLLFDSAAAPIAGMIGRQVGNLAPVFLIPFAAVLFALLSQGGIAMTGDKLKPKWSRLSPLATARQKFGPDGLFEFGKSAVKLIAVSVVLNVFMIARADEIMGAIYLSPVMSSALLSQIIGAFLLQVVMVSAVIGLFDYVWQRRQHLQRHRMTRREMLEEHKDQEGDPHTKAERRQRGHDIATNRMLVEVATADVVILNPTHFAVALKWNRSTRRAPTCVAKGVDEIAARIRERAAEAGVPMHQDRPTARALFATVEIGQDIRPDQYRAVAAAIRFAEAMRRRSRQSGRAP